MRRIRGSLAILAALLLLAAGCGDDDGGSDDGAAATTTTAASDSGESGDEGDGSDGGEGCDPSDPFKIGTIFPLTGVTADTGEKATIGVEIAVEEVNANGGVLGRCVEVVAKDEANDPTKAAQAASELIDQVGVSALVGPAGSGPTGAVAPIAAEANVPFVAFSALSIPREEAPTAFTVQITSGLIGPSFLAFAQEAGWETLAIIATNTTFGTSIVDAVKGSAAEYGVEVVAVEVHESGAVDLGPQLRSLRDSGADALVVASFGGDAIVALKAREAIGWDAPAIGPSGLSFDEVVEGVGPTGMEGVYSSMYPARLAADTETGELPPEGEAFRQAVKEHLGVDELTDNLDAIALGYDAFMAMVAGINGAGTDDADAVIEYLISNGFSGKRADYVWTEENNQGFTIASNAIVIAASLSDGVLTLAPTN